MAAIGRTATGEKTQEGQRPIKAWNKRVSGHIDNKMCSFQEAIRELEKEAQSKPLEECEWLRMDALRSQ